MGHRQGGAAGFYRTVGEEGWLELVSISNEGQ